MESFASTQDTAARSAALFTELGKVLTHPRCANRHPAGDRPRQGDAMRLHQPPVERGADGFGLPAMRCPIVIRLPISSPPVSGQPDLAPRAARDGLGGQGARGDLCELKDPARNGNRSLETLIEHIGDDHLVGWAWAPGYGRLPAPGTQKEAGALVKAWVKTGAECPD